MRWNIMFSAWLMTTSVPACWLNGCCGAGYILEPPQTNMLFVDAGELDRGALSAWLHEHGVKADCLGRDNIRLVTHLDITDEDIEHAARVFEQFQTRA
jgi:threonine aldolase